MKSPTNTKSKQILNNGPPADLLPEESKDLIKLSEEDSSESGFSAGSGSEEQKISQIRVGRMSRSMSESSKSQNEIPNDQERRQRKLVKKIGSLDEKQSVQTGKFGNSESGQFSGSFNRPAIFKDVEIQVSDSFAALQAIEDYKSDSDPIRKEGSSANDPSLYSFQNKCKNDSGTQTDSVPTTDAGNQTDFEQLSSMKSLSKQSSKNTQKYSGTLSWWSLKSGKKQAKRFSLRPSGFARKLGKSISGEVEEEDMTEKNERAHEKGINRSWHCDLRAPNSDSGISPNQCFQSSSSCNSEEEEMPIFIAKSEDQVKMKKLNQRLQQRDLSEDSNDARQAHAPQKKHSKDLSQQEISVTSSKSSAGSKHKSKHEDVANPLELRPLNANNGTTKQRAYTQIYNNSKYAAMINVKELSSSTIVSSPPISMTDQMQQLHEFFGLCYIDRGVVELQIIHPKPEMQDQSTFMTPPKGREEESKGSPKLRKQSSNPEDINILADKPVKKMAKGKSLIQRNQRPSLLQHSSFAEMGSALSQQDQRLDPNSSLVLERQDNLNDNAASCQVLPKDAALPFSQRQVGASSAQAKEQSKAIAAGVPKPNRTPPTRAAAAAAMTSQQQVLSQARQPDQIERLSLSQTRKQKVQMKPQNS